jgi:hypothetical protein
MDLAIERLVLALADDAADAEETANSFEWRRLPRVLARRVAQMVDVVGVAAPHNVAAIDRLHRVVDDDEASTRLRVASSVRLDAAALARLAGFPRESWRARSFALRISRRRRRFSGGISYFGCG